MTLQTYDLYGVRHTYVEYNNAGTIAFKRCYLTDKCDIKVSNTKIQFSGDGQKYSKNFGYQADGSVEFDIEDNTVDSILFGTPSVAPQSGDDFASRYVRGTDAELASTFVGLRISLDGEDHFTGAPVVVRYRILKIQFDPDTPPQFQSEAKATRMVSWSARKAYTDIVGTTVTGLPARGAFWVKDFITNSANFDPVPNDQI